MNNTHPELQQELTTLNNILVTCIEKSSFRLYSLQYISSVLYNQELKNTVDYCNNKNIIDGLNSMFYEVELNSHLNNSTNNLIFIVGENNWELLNKLFGLSKHICDLNSTLDDICYKNKHDLLDENVYKKIISMKYFHETKKELAAVETQLATILF